MVPTYDNFIETMEMKDKLEKMKDKILPGNPMYAQYNHELDKAKAKTVLYYLLLMDDNLIKPTIKLFNLFLHMLPGWLQIDYEQLADCRFPKKYKPSKLTYYLP